MASRVAGILGFAASATAMASLTVPAWNVRPFCPNSPHFTCIFASRSSSSGRCAEPLTAAGGGVYAPAPAAHAFHLHICVPLPIVRAVWRPGLLEPRRGKVHCHSEPLPIVVFRPPTAAGGGVYAPAPAAHAVRADADQLLHPQQTMPHQEFCVEVPDTTIGTDTIANNSRWAFVAEPTGSSVPAGGWPVMIQLAIIDFNPEIKSILKNKGQCGLDGNIPGGHGFRRR